MQTKLPVQFESIQQQLEEHLATINENTSEVQSLFDYLREIELKIDRLGQRVDDLQLRQTEKIPSISLSQIEKKIFLALYTEEVPVSHQEIAVKAQVPVSLVVECISSMVEKGVTFKRSVYNNKLFLQLDREFKELQAREGLVNLSLQSFM